MTSMIFISNRNIISVSKLLICFFSYLPISGFAQVVNKQEKQLLINKLQDKNEVICFPDTDIRKELEDKDRQLMLSNPQLADIEESKFRAIIDEVVDSYRPLIESHEATITVNYEWEDSTINATANQFGSSWIINMFGGLARHPTVTEDGFEMVVCHELGHHLGGFPFKGERWAANEGQSDYFASQACLRRVWQNQEEKNQTRGLGVDPVAKEKCDLAYESVPQQNLCYRIANAGQSLANLLAELRGQQPPSYGTPDTTQVSTTDDNHPAAQCRVDSYLAGALCRIEFPETIIPARSHPNGQGSLLAEQDASSYSCMYGEPNLPQNRPRCWFSKQGKYGPTPVVEPSIFAAITQPANPDSVKLVLAIDQSVEVDSMKICSDQLNLCLNESSNNLSIYSFQELFGEKTLFRGIDVLAPTTGEQNLILMGYRDEYDLPFVYKPITLRKKTMEN